MDPAAIAKANSRLRTAKKAIEDLTGCNDYDTFSEYLYTFLVAAKGIYTILEQGAKSRAQARQWFGAKSKERRSDPLLQYLYQARDDDEHGLSRVVEHVPGALGIGVSKPGFSNAIRLDGSIGPGGTLLRLRALMACRYWLNRRCRTFGCPWTGQKAVDHS